MTNTEMEFKEFIESIKSTGPKRKAAYKSLGELTPKLSFEEILELIPLFHDSLGDSENSQIVYLIQNLLPVIRKLYVSDTEEYRIQAMLLVAPLTELVVNSPKAIKKATVKCLKRVIPMLNETDFRGYVYSVSKALLMDDSDCQNQVFGLVLVDAMLPRLSEEEKIQLLLPKLPDLLMSKDLSLRKNTIKTYSLLSTQLPIEYIDGMIVPAIVCGANDKDFIVRKKASECITSIAEIAVDSKSNLIRPFFSLVQDANKPNAIVSLKQIPHFLHIIGKKLANQYSKEILPILVNLSSDTVRLFPDAPTSVGKSLVSIINFYMETKSETVFTIVKNLANSGAIGARYSVGVCFQLFMPYVKAEDTRAFFLELYDSLLKDEKVVQLAAISSLADVIGIVNPEYKERYMKSFMSFMEDPFWRVRLQIASSFSRVVQSVGESVDVQTYLFKLLNDPMAATRSKAAEVTAQVYMISSKEFKQKVRNNFIVLSKRNYHRRKIIIEFISWIFGEVKSMDEGLAILDNFFMPFFLLCVDDPVPNVRIHLCHAIYLISSKYPNFIQISNVRDCCYQLMADDEQDVSSIAKELFETQLKN
ncbi:hypothetical protein ENUP19_0304G0038 [Entamoeba nuttalli]|uniref:HEAT repeat domain containing protein n=2 Tax=Entamoeba nuttalli TaxID=412467 RepID=K2H6I3_ENTNP|nr:HEAT repeat domain containing protein [Entamoeba nuttalli P19]EKE38099.1 HEAT repeat domain containing protein [Entamoeba nuttalli P19]|eukprot:XP_008859570.1 HEAT repeat domain containing protein [Entamoeba nuttalli P19]